MGWNYLSIPKLQRLHCWSLGMDKWFHPTVYNGCDYLSMLGLKLNHVSKRGPRSTLGRHQLPCWLECDLAPHISYHTACILCYSQTLRIQTTYRPYDFVESFGCANWYKAIYVDVLFLLHFNNDYKNTAVHKCEQNVLRNIASLILQRVAQLL